MFFFVLKYAPSLNHTVNLKDALDRKYFIPPIFSEETFSNPLVLKTSTHEISSLTNFESLIKPPCPSMFLFSSYPRCFFH